MNILFVHDYPWSGYTGIITHIRNIAIALAERGHNVEIVARGERKCLIEKGIKIQLFPKIWSGAHSIDLNDFDIVHAHDILSSLMLREKSTIIITNHGVFADPDFHHSYYDWCDVPYFNGYPWH